jgi:hypothetical protein
MTTDPLLEELREQTKWLRLLGLQALRPLLLEALTTEKHKQVYELTDGDRTIRQIGDQVGIAPGTVSRWWSQWISQGICDERQDVPGRARKLYSLTRLGIAVSMPNGKVLSSDATAGAENGEA